MVIFVAQKCLVLTVLDALEFSGKSGRKAAVTPLTVRTNW
jgi:hypothetical protein